MVSQNLVGGGETSTVETPYAKVFQENKMNFSPKLSLGRTNDVDQKNGHQIGARVTYAPGYSTPPSMSNPHGLPNIWQTSRPKTSSNLEIELDELKSELREYKATTTHLISAISLDLYRMKTKQGKHNQSPLNLSGTDTRLAHENKELALKNRVLLAENAELKREVEVLRNRLGQRQPGNFDLAAINDPDFFLDNDTQISRIPPKFQQRALVRADQKAIEHVRHAPSEPKQPIDALCSGRESEWSAYEEADDTHYLSEPSQSSCPSDQDDSDEGSTIGLTEDEDAGMDVESDEDQTDCADHKRENSKRIENLDWTQFHSRRRYLGNDRVQLPSEELTFDHLSPDGLQAREDDSAYPFVVIRPNISLQNKTPKQMLSAAAKVFPPSTVRSVELLAHRFWKLYLDKDTMLDTKTLEKLGTILDLTKWVKVVITGLPDHITPKLLKKELDDGYKFPTASTPLAVGRRNGVYTAIVPFKNPDHAQALVDSGFLWDSYKRRVRHYDPGHRSKPLASKTATINHLPIKKRFSSRN